MSELIFEKGRFGRQATGQLLNFSDAKMDIPKRFLREDFPVMPEVSELDVVRHYTSLSQQNFSVDTHFYPLGSCTMKYNPHVLKYVAKLPGFADRHPYALPQYSQGLFQCLYELQELLKEITGMDGVSLAPMAGAQGEFAGVSMIRAYHLSRGDNGRTEIIVPNAAHGTNPASAVMCGYKVVEIPTMYDGDVDLDVLRSKLGPQTAGIMLTNPSTLGVFERKIQEIAEMVHNAGGLLYYDGANLNAILGKARPGDMGFDVLHLNLHKTFGTPHGGGGPGCGPVAACNRLVPFLPVPVFAKEEEEYIVLDERSLPQSIGPLSAFMGNVAVMLRAYIYIRMLGAEGLKRVGEYSTLSSNYLMRQLEKIGFDIPYGDRLASHEFIVSLQKEAKNYNVTAMDFAKRLLDFGFHAPTTYFPLLVPECLLIEPTETESKQEIDAFVAVMKDLLKEAESNPQLLRDAPHNRPLRRLDDVKAARNLDLKYKTPL